MASSELIVNPDGTIYHLGLRPEQMAPLVITVGDPERVDVVSQYFDAVDYRVSRREFVSHGGSFAGRRILCISTGIGTDNIDIVLNELDALANVDFETGQPKSELTRLTFLRLGTSGTFQPEIAVDTLLGSSSAVGIDGLGPFYRFATGAAEACLRNAYPAFAGAAYTGTCDSQLLNVWQSSHLEHQIGVTLTCAGFYGPQRRSVRLPFVGPSLTELAALRFGDGSGLASGRFTNFEMETAGIYGLANLLGHRALSLNAILANRANDTFSTRSSETVERLIDSAFNGLQAHPTLWWDEGVD